jgi:FGGY-family pentulose kinase
MADLVAAVDVGTGSARAGIFDASGRMLGRVEAPIETHRPEAGFAEQDSEAIWSAVAAAVRAARAEAAAPPDMIRAIAFDATASLVVRDGAGRPLPVSDSGGACRDTVLWLDHRARDEAAACSAAGDPTVLEEGGALSPEMQIPKLLWLKRNLPRTWARMGYAFDLSDFLAWRASGTSARSICTLACKWAYRPRRHEPWACGFFRKVGLGDIVARAGLPARAAPVGADLGPLTDDAANALGLRTDTRVAAGLIDAHAGALSALGSRVAEPGTSRTDLALIAGTSNCLMAMTREASPVPGLWGPYWDAVLPGMAVQEGGQSASGALLDHVCRIWGAAEPAAAVHGGLWRRIAELRRADGWDLAADLHVLPDFAGNRSPNAEPAARGVVSGLALDASFDGLARLYWRAAVGIAVGLRPIIALLAGCEAARPVLHLSGGHVRSPLLVGLYATATGCNVTTAAETDSVLLGTAMAGATAAGLHPDLPAASRAMAPTVNEHRPDPAGRDAMDRAERILRTMQRHRRELVEGPPGAL